MVRASPEWHFYQWPLCWCPVKRVKNIFHKRCVWKWCASASAFLDNLKKVVPQHSRVGQWLCMDCPSQILGHGKAPVRYVKSSEIILALSPKDLYHAIFLCVWGASDIKFWYFFFLVKIICDCCFTSSFSVYYAAVKPAGFVLFWFLKLISLSLAYLQKAGD